MIGLAVSAARLLLAFCMVFTYPMECLVTRHCFLSIIQRVIYDRNAIEDDGEKDNSRNNRQNIHSRNFEERNPMLTNTNCVENDNNNNNNNEETLKSSSNEHKNEGFNDFEICEESDVIYFSDFGISNLRDPRSMEKSEIKNIRREKSEIMEKVERKKRGNNKGIDMFRPNG